MTTEMLFEYCPFLTSANVTLSRAGAADTDALFALMRDETLTKLEPEPAAKRPADAVRRLSEADELFSRGKSVLLGVYANTDLSRMIGWVELGGINLALELVQMRFLFARSALSTALPEEAIKAVVRYLFEIVRINRLQVVTLAADTGKHMILEKAGFVKEGTLRAFRRWRDETLADITFHALLASDYAALRDPKPDEPQADEEEPDDGDGAFDGFLPTEGDDLSEMTFGETPDV